MSRTITFLAIDRIAITLTSRGQRPYVFNSKHGQDHVSQEQDEWSTVKNKKQAKDCS